MENAATATVETPLTAPKTEGYGFKDFLRDARSGLKAVSGVVALGIGGAMVVSGLPFLMVLGAAAVYTGGRQVYEAGRELLPLKAQSFISRVFTGKEMTEKKPVEGPKTPLGIGIRVAEYVALAFSGAVAFSAAGWAMGMGSEAASTGWLFLGGFTSMASGVTNVIERAVSGVVSLAKEHGKKDAAKTVESASQAPAPDLSPAPALTAKAAEAGFNAAAAPAAEAAAEQPKPQPVVTPPAPPAVK